MIAVLGAKIWEPLWYQRVELLAHDLHGTIHLQSKEQHTAIAIIDIDDASIDAIGAWPWPRTVIAQLVSTLFERYQARTVGLDIVYPEPADQTGDVALAALAQRHPLVLAQAFDFSGRSDSPRTGKLGGSLIEITPSTSSAVEAAMPVASGYIANHAGLVGSACIGHITPRPDFDGQVRRIAPFVRHDNSVYPMLAIAMLGCASRQQGVAPNIEAPALKLGAEMTHNGYMQVPLKAGLQGYTVIPAIALFSEAIPPDLLKDRHVLVGSSALGLGDRVSTPLHPWLPGVMVHAQVLDGLIEQQINPQPHLDLTWVAWGWAASSAVALAILFALTRARIALAGLLMIPLGWILLADRLLSAGHHLPVALPLVGISFFLFIQAPFEWSRAQSDTEKFIARFRQYLPPVMVDLLVKQRSGTDVLKAARKCITVLFVDLRGYTAMAEEMQPELLVEYTQWVLGALTNEVHHFGGTLDKYMGDALMAFWGAPIDQPDHPDLALDCATGMQAAIARLNSVMPSRFPGINQIEICIGINSGDAVVGELGTLQRSAFTAIGDTVNLASRLQDFAKTIDHKLLIGPGTAELVRRHRLQLLEHIAIRGRRKGAEIYILDSASESLLPSPQTLARQA